jgi:hypothetical protein
MQIVVILYYLGKDDKEKVYVFSTDHVFQIFFYTSFLVTVDAEPRI